MKYPPMKTLDLSTASLLVHQVPNVALNTTDLSLRATSEERDWMMSSLELRDGLKVREMLDTMPAELLDLM